jgi:hypothetical protein
MIFVNYDKKRQFSTRNHRYPALLTGKPCIYLPSGSFHHENGFFYLVAIWVGSLSSEGFDRCNETLAALHQAVTAMFDKLWIVNPQGVVFVEQADVMFSGAS